MRIGIFIFLTAISLASNAQKKAEVWRFGNNGAGLDFSCSPPMATYSQTGLNALEGTSSICDSLGNLLFYSNGDSVWNKNNMVMPNGAGLGMNPTCSGSSTQGSIIIPVPGSNNLYYIFNNDCAEAYLASGFKYSIVDMSLNGGLGDVTVKAQQLIDTVCEKLCAVRMANDAGVWVLTHKFNSDAFYAYAVTNAGLDTTPVISHAGQWQYPTISSSYPECAARGNMKFSPDGKKIVVLQTSDCHSYMLYPEIFDFNDITGQVTLDYTISDPDSTIYYGACFSPNSNMLYLTAGWYGCYLHQFNVGAATNSATFLASKTVIFNDPTAANGVLGGMTIGPDGNIHVATYRWWIDVINNPNVPGLGCNYQQKAIRLRECPMLTYSCFNMPNFIESYFLTAYTGTPCIDTLHADFSFSTPACKNVPVHFTDLSAGIPDTVNYWEWDFGNPTSGPANFSTLQNPSHTFLFSGSYNVRLIVTSGTVNCKKDTITKTVGVTLCTDVSENETSYPAINIFPNPFQNSTVIELANVIDADIAIYSVSGQQIHKIEHKNQNDLTLEIGQNLPPGMYILVVKTTEGLVTKKLVKTE